MRTFLLAATLVAALPACNKAVSAPPDDPKPLVLAFLAPGADYAALSAKLRPTKADYAAVWDAEFAAALEAMYTPAWDGGQIVIKPNPGQTEHKLFRATAEELKANAAAAFEFPGGYRKSAPHLKPGVVMFAFKFVEPGKTLGMSYDGLVYVNGHWVIMPKAWRAVH